MSDEELRNLERRALSGDLSAALRYLLTLERNGGMTDPVFPTYNYNSKYGNILISPQGDVYSFPTVMVFSPATQHLSDAFKAQLEYRGEFKEGGPLAKELKWRTDRFAFLSDYSLTNGPHGVTSEIQRRSALREEISRQLEIEVTAWVASHLAEMHHAEDLGRQQHLYGLLENLHRTYKKLNDEEDKISKLAVEWLSKRCNYSLSESPSPS